MIQAKVIADSLSPQGNRITSMIVTMPRFILAEFNTHRMFSRNSASSRAIPFKKMVEMVEKNPFIPMAWQKDHKGMQGENYITDDIDIERNNIRWRFSRDAAIDNAKLLHESSVTKQLCNRLLEPFMYHTVLVTSTEWENFWKLRCPQYQHQDGPIFRSWKDLVKYAFDSGASRDWVDELENYSVLDRLKYNKGQAEIHMMAVAEAMYDAYNESTPKKLAHGEWHIPFKPAFLSFRGIDEDGTSRFIQYVPNPLLPDEIKDSIKVAIARCARISYLNFEGKDDSIADIKLYDQLAKSGHWSPFEHCARAMTTMEYASFVNGYINIDWENKKALSVHQGWCRNFRGFIQTRHLVENNLPF